jgi:hypothetical protein
MDIEKLKALALGYVYENGDHWYSEHQVSDGISYEPASEFIVGCTPAAVLELIAEVERLRADAGRLDFVDRSGCAIRDFHDQRKNVIEWIAPGDLRGAIDAAIEKEKA